MKETAGMKDFFSVNSFERKICEKCGSSYWTRDPERRTCGDPPCDPYSFIGSSDLKRKTVDEMRESFIDYFRGSHGFVNPYPVVPRWREDVLLVNASIYDFQPHVTGGYAEPPQNPLVMSQPCIRMLDVDLVGMTGRHLTSFEMMCHDAFNKPGHYVYWKDETLSYCYSFLTESLGVNGDIITFKEKPWSGGGNGGNAVEVLVRGLEVATLVFMDMKEDPEGEFEIDGLRYSRMDRTIIDTGYGLERLAWLTTGTPTIYDTVFERPINFIYTRLGLKEPSDRIRSLNSIISSEHQDYGQSALNSAVVSLSTDGESDQSEIWKSLETYRNISIVVDHVKTVLLLLNEKVLPSNVKVGYVLRFLIRRIIKSLKALNGEHIIFDILDMEAKEFSSILPNTDREFINRIIGDELKKYQEINERGRRIIGRLIERKGKLNQKDLLMLYDSNGIDPDTAARINEDLTGIRIDVAEDFRSRISAMHSTTIKRSSRENIPEIHTRPLYYDDTKIRDFTGIVMYSRDGKVVLNQTAFYPEGGGQPCDLGTLQRGGMIFPVTYVEKIRDTIVHHVDGRLEEKWRVQGHIDYSRRWQLMIHHSATHLILAVLREVLGDHVWQIGVQKGIDSSRIDISHFGRLDYNEIRKVEERCLEIIQENRRITARFMEWNHALDKFGFRLFQGGVPVNGRLRVVEIDGIDAEGCGGTHLSSTGPIGMIKILSCDTIQENVQRITFVAGPALLRYVSGMQAAMDKLTRITRADAISVPEKVEAMQKELLETRKKVEDVRKQRIRQIMSASRRIKGKNGDALMVDFQGDDDDLKLLIGSLASTGTLFSVILNEKAGLMYVVSKGSPRSDDILKSLLNNNVPHDARLGERFSSSRFSGILDESLIRKYLL